MRLPQFFGDAVAEFEADDDGSRPAIYITVRDDGADGNWEPKEVFAALSVESAARLAEQIDAAIDLSARTNRARAEAIAARIAGLRATLEELETDIKDS